MDIGMKKILTQNFFDSQKAHLLQSNPEKNISWDRRIFTEFFFLRFLASELSEKYFGIFFLLSN